MSTLNATKRSTLVDGPVRRIGVQSRSVTGTMPNGNRYESTLERDFMLLMKFDPLVDIFTPQPLTLTFLKPDGETSWYTPDGLIEWRKDLDVYDRRPVLVEIKYRDDFAGLWQEWRCRARASQRYAYERGWIFRIYTEREIRTPLLENAAFLLPYLRRETAPETEAWVLDRLDELGQSTPTSILSSLFRDRWNQARLIPVLWRLLAERRIGFDLTRPLTMNSLIWTVRFK